MLQNILEVKGVKKLSKNSQQQVQGGVLIGATDTLCNPRRPSCSDAVKFYSNNCYTWICGATEEIQ